MKKGLSLAAVLLMTSFAFAQDTTKTLDEVVVTANRFPNKSQNTGKVVNVITKEQIERSGSKDLSQILSEQAGLYVNGGFSNPGKDKSVYLRGAKVDHTLITIDGIPVYDPSGIGSNFDIRWLSIDNVERIEILKGSQSTLYGSDAIAGVINIITKKANKKAAAFSGRAQYGSFNTLNASAGISGTKNRFDYTVNLALLQSNGINEATDTTPSIPPTDRDGYTQKNLYASFGYKPSEKISIRPYIRYATFIQNYDQGAFVDELDLTANSTNLQYGLKNEFVIGKAKLMVNYNYNKIDRTYVDDSTKSRNGYDIYNKGVYKGSEHFADAFMIYPLSNRIKITGGLEWRASSTSQQFVSIGAWPFNSELGADSLKQQQISGYLSGLYQNNKGLSIEAGTRWNHHDAYGNHLVYNLNPSWLIDNNFKLFANVSTAFKTPSLYQLYSEYGNQQLNPETGLTLEAGTEYYSTDGKQKLGLTFFDRKVKNLIFFYYDPASFSSFYINQDRQHDHGFELELNSNWGKQFTTRAFLSYVNGQVTSVKDGKDTNYFNLLRRPKWSGGFTLSKEIRKRFFASLSMVAFGERKDVSFDASFNTVEVQMNAYALVNVYLEYKMMKNKLNIFADLKNINNAKYAEVYGFNTPGFNAYGGVRFTF